MEVVKSLKLYYLNLILLIVQLANCLELKNSLNKCCPVLMKYNDVLGSCLPSNSSYEGASYDYLSFSPRLVQRWRNLDADQHFEFGLRTELPHCANGNFIIEISTVRTESQFTTDGYLQIGDEYYSPNEYCIFNFHINKLVLRVCNATCSSDSLCLTKCCPLNQVWNSRQTGDKCSSGNQEVWRPTFYDSPNRKPAKLPNLLPHYKIVYPKSQCKSLNRIGATQQEHNPSNTRWGFHLNQDGIVYLPRRHFGVKTLNLSAENFYCLDGDVNAKLNEDGTLPGILNFCFIPAVQADWLTLLNGICMIVSCVCLTLTILVQILLWDRQPNHRRSLVLISYFVSLFLMYFFFIIRHFWALSKLHGNDRFCYFVGVGLHFSFLSTFGWLTSISFDYWFTFKSLQLARYADGGYRYLKSYFRYAAVPIAISISIVAVGLTLDSVYGEAYRRYETEVVIPDYGTECYLDREYAQLYYAYGPVGLILVINLALFLVTIVNLVRTQKSTKIAKENCAQSGTKNTIILGKLLIIMGIPWMFEVISWYFEQDSADKSNLWLWSVFDLINTLQGIFIFWIFVCQEDAIRILREKYTCFRWLYSKVTLDTETTSSIEMSHPTLSLFVSGLLRRMTRKNPDSPTSDSSKQTTSTTIL